MKGFWHKLKRNWKIELLEIIFLILISIFISLSMFMQFDALRKIRLDDENYYKYNVSQINFDGKNISNQDIIDYYTAVLDSLGYEYGFVNNKYIDQNVANKIQFTMEQGEGFSNHYYEEYSEAIVTKEWIETHKFKLGDIVSNYIINNINVSIQESGKPIKIVGVVSKNLIFVGPFGNKNIKMSSENNHLIIKEQNFVPKNAFIFNASEQGNKQLDDGNKLEIKTPNFERVYEQDLLTAKDLFNLSLILSIFALIAIISITYINIDNIKFANSLYFLMGESKKSIILGTIFKVLAYLIFGLISPLVFYLINMVEIFPMLLATTFIISVYVLSQILKVVVTVKTKAVNIINKERQ